ncbi:NAD-dependent epimerase/dehydratase family protein [Dermacoccus nishinomiyaensis]
MKHVVIGAGQIGSALTRELAARGEDVVVIRRSETPVAGARVVVSDVLNTDVLSRELASAGAVYHCIHAPYDHRAWRRDLPQREVAVMDAAARAGVPVVFPESVYAYGQQATCLHEGVGVAPCTPLGHVRADLLAARARHEARTASVVASDLFGPTANEGSVATLMIFRPLSRGRRAWVPANLDAAHSWTYLPDLAKAMIYAATHQPELSASMNGSSDLVVHAPTAEPRSCRQLATDAAAHLRHPARIGSVPVWPLAVAARFDATAREVHAQRYLWRERAVLHPGALSEAGLTPTPWSVSLKDSLSHPVMGDGRESGASRLR